VSYKLAGGRLLRPFFSCQCFAKAFVAFASHSESIVRSMISVAVLRARTMRRLTSFTRPFDCSPIMNTPRGT
jgi:hypothetical protein